jgi:phytoene dehydrogenase-like protein
VKNKKTNNQQMKSKDDNRKVIIIGAGFAGLAAGIYAQMNGYQTKIFEMHDKAGGLCTSWKRMGYTIDGCIHWLVGSKPGTDIYDLWEEVGVVPDRNFVNMDEYIRFVDKEGKNLIFYTNVDKLKKHLLEYAPEDAKTIKELTNAIKFCRIFDNPSRKTSVIKRVSNGIRIGINLILKGRTIKRLMNTSSEDFASRFNNRFLRLAFNELWIPEFSVFFIMLTFAFLHNKNAGYPLGGSMPMTEAMEARYKALGGIIIKNSKVERILVKNNRASGVRLSDGSEHLCDKVISAADGYTTIFKLLEGKYGNQNTCKPYEKWTPFSPLIYIGLGFADDFRHWAKTVSGTMIELQNRIEIAGQERSWLSIHPYYHDPGLAPPGKTSVVIMLPTTYNYWKELYKTPELYNKAKEEIAAKIVTAIEETRKDLKGKVEMIDVATPMTFERYTGNWKGSFEGWLITPQNAYTIMKKMAQTIEGLSDFFMCGQWVEPGGGLPTSVMSAKRLIRQICKEDNRKFHVVF